MTRALLAALLLAACSVDRRGGVPAELDGPDPGLGVCTGCPCCCARVRYDGRFYIGDAFDLPEENVTPCRACLADRQAHPCEAIQ